MFYSRKFSVTYISWNKFKEIFEKAKETLGKTYFNLNIV